MLLEHMRLAQWDILDFCRNPKYKEMKWPDEYWPKTVAPPSDAAWRASIAGFKRDLRAMIRLVNDPRTDLYAPIPWWHKPISIMREAMLIGDHNAYHIGQMIDDWFAACAGHMEGLMELDADLPSEFFANARQLPVQSEGDRIFVSLDRKAEGTPRGSTN
jgi:hypothetical protein